MTLNQIVAAANQLTAAEFLKLRRRLDRIEERLWRKELERTSKRLVRQGVTESAIDRLVLRRRGQSH